MQPRDKGDDDLHRKKKEEEDLQKSPKKHGPVQEKQKSTAYSSTEKSNNKFLSYLIEARPLNLISQRKNKYNGCNCRKSQCLKMYCICFSSGKMCGQGCLCDSCQNKTDNAQRAEAINQIISKDPFAFSRGDVNIPEYTHQGCNCKKSGCSKKYCICFSKRRKCGKECRCLGCQNPYKEEASSNSEDPLQKKMKIQSS